MIVQSWGQAIQLSLLSLWDVFVRYIPALIGAIIILLIGWIIAVALGKLVAKLFKMVKIDEAFDKTGLNAGAQKHGFSISISGFLGGLVKWFFILVFLMAAANILSLDPVTIFLNEVLNYLPNVAVAVIILAMVFIVGNFVYHIVRGSTKAAGVISASILAAISKWSIIVFGILVALQQLGIAYSLINVIFIGLVAMLAIAGGLAFGLGGKEEAQLILKKLRQEISERQ